MPRRERPLLERGPDRHRELQEPEGVRDRRTVLADALGDLFLRQAEVLAEVAVGVGLLERRQVAALEVLDEGEEEVVAVRESLADHDGHLASVPRGERRGPAARRRGSGSGRPSRVTRIG